jgi:hypothetical protein
VANGHLVGAGVCHLELRQMPVDRVVEAQQAGVDELHHRECSEGLAQRGDPEQRVRRHWAFGGVVSVAAHHQHLVAAGDRDRNTWDG